MNGDRSADMAHLAPPAEDEGTKPFVDQATPIKVVNQRRRFSRIRNLAAAATLAVVGLGAVGVEPAKTLDRHIVGAAQNTLNLAQHWDDSEKSSSAEQTPPPILVFTGKLDVSADYVNRLKVRTFGGVEVSGDIPFYQLSPSQFEETPQGPVVDVSAILTDGSPTIVKVAFNPTAQRGGGPANGSEGAVVDQPGSVGLLADTKAPDGSPFKTTQLGLATPGIGSMPTPQP